MNVTLDFILQNESNKYVSFYPNYTSIVLLMKLLLIPDGDDIFINTYLNSTTRAHVSVSSDNINYVYLGILNNTHKSFDLSVINHTSK